MNWLKKLSGWLFPGLGGGTVSNGTDPTIESMEEAENPTGTGSGYGTFQKIWRDLTGQSQIDQQNLANLALSKYQAQMQEDFYNKYSSPSAIMRQMQEAGLNPNLAYGNASSGQSNVPKFDVQPSQRRLSGFEQIAKGVSLLSTLYNMQNLKYNAVANREVAEQSQIKTLSAFEDLIGKRQKNMLSSQVTGFAPQFKLDPFFKRSSIGRTPSDFHYSTTPTLYSLAARNLMLNNALKNQYNTAWEFGHAYDWTGGDFFPSNEDYIPNAYWRNQVLESDAGQRWFNLDWDNDYKTLFKGAGIVGPVLRILQGFFGGHR